MKCKKCGNNMSDGVSFCAMCGEKNIQDSSNNQEQEPIQLPINPPQNPVNNQVRDETEESGRKPEAGANYPKKAATSKKKLHKTLKIAGICVAILAILGIIAFFIWRPVFFAINPEKYTAMLVRDTLSDAIDELDKIEKNVFGFDVSMDDEYTIGANYKYEDRHGKEGAEIHLANNPDDNELLFDASIDDDGQKNGVYGFIDDENAGAALPGSSGDYLVVPSKDFGKRLLDSNGYISEIAYDEMSRKERDFLSGIDFSYSEIKGILTGDGKTSKAVKDVFSDSIVTFLEKCEISKRESTKYSFNNDDVNAKKITISMKSEDLYDFFIDTIDALQDNETLKENLDDNALDILDKLSDEIDEAKEYIDFEDIDIEIIEYKGRIVQLSIEYEIKSSDYYDEYYEKIRTTVSSTDKKYLLNGIDIITKTEYDTADSDEYTDNTYKGEDTYEFGFTANWVNEDEKITAKAYANESGQYDYSYEYSDGDKGESKRTYEDSYDLWGELDYNKGKWKAGMKENHNRDYSDSEPYSYENEYEFDGKCTKKDGFKFELDNEFQDEYYDYSYSMSYDEWLEEKFEDNREDYLYDVYWSSSYSDYDEWYDDMGYMWDTADSDFEEWLEDEEDYYDIQYLYNNETWQETAYTDTIKVVFDITLKDSLELKRRKGDYDNILDWNKRDFEDFEDEFYDATH